MNLLLFAVVFLIPLLGATNGFGFEQIKVLFFILSISLIGFIWLFGKPKIPLNAIKIISGIFILGLLISSILGIDLKSSLLGKEPYFQGLCLYAYLFLFAMMVSTARIKLIHWAYVLVGSASLVSLLAIKDWVLLNLFATPVPTYAGRVISTFGQPNFYAGFLLLTLPFCYLLFKNPEKRLQILGWGSGMVSLVGILVSYSRLTILMMLLLLILGLTGELKIKLRVGFMVIAVVVASIFIALVFSSGLVGNEITGAISTNNPDLTKESIEKRAYIWPQAFQIILQKPVAGYGLENIDRSFTGYFAKNKHSLFEANSNISPVLISLKELNINRSHNYFLDLLLFAGVLGLLTWVFLIAVLLLHSRGILLVSILTYLVWVQFQNQSVVHLIYFWLLVGLIDEGVLTKRGE